MKFCIRLRLRKTTQFKYKKYSRSIRNRWNSTHIDNDNNNDDAVHDYPQSHQQHVELSVDKLNQLSNNMTHVVDNSSGDARRQYLKDIPSPVNEQQIVNAQTKVDRLMNLISDTYEKTLVRNLRLEELDVRSTDLFRDAEKMKNMAQKMHDKFFWEDSKFETIRIVTVLLTVCDRHE
jgi:hypothetical protein